MNSANAEVELATNQRAPALADYLERIRDAAVSRRPRLVDTFSVLTDPCTPASGKWEPFDRIGRPGSRGWRPTLAGWGSGAQRYGGEPLAPLAELPEDGHERLAGSGEEILVAGRMLAIPTAADHPHLFELA